MRVDTFGLNLATASVVLALGCSGGSPTEPTAVVGNAAGSSPLVAPAATAPGATSGTVTAQGGPRPRPESWADCERFAGVVTPATFKPESDPFDELYMGGNGFADGVMLISESKPGDPDYNGGRWHVNRLKSGVDPAKYADACRVEDLDLADFEPTSDYFECPLLPRRGRR